MLAPRTGLVGEARPVVAVCLWLTGLSAAAMASGAPADELRTRATSYWIEGLGLARWPWADVVGHGTGVVW